MIDFTKAKKAKVKAKDYRVGRTVYDYSTNSWSVAIKGIGTIPIVEKDCSIQGVKRLYSTPHNNSHDEWTETWSSGKYNTDVIARYWSKFKPDMKLKGNVINNEFVLK